MRQALQLRRSNLAHDVAQVLRSWVIDGVLEPGRRLNEVHLAEELGVSRTPLREAIGQVAADGLLEQRPRLGYFVRGLDLQEFVDLYAMRRILDPAALELAGLPSAELSRRLEAINQQIVDSAGDPRQVIDLDNRWHFALLEHCPNRILLEQIEHFIRRTCRYELAYFREQAHVGVAVDEHRAIQRALERRDLAAAVSGLRQNMTSADGPIRRWLIQRQQQTEGREKS